MAHNLEALQSFRWEFSNKTQWNQLQICTRLPITIIPYENFTGIPPFYMLAYAIGGTPETTLLGTDRQALSWVPNHPPGTSLFLGVVDSAGNPGGIGSTGIYSIVDNEDMAPICVLDENNSDFTISVNVTDDLMTCQPWGIRIKGGVQPYNMTLIAIDSPIVVNVTLPVGDDIFTYINRDNPGGQLSVAVCDANGKWARGTPMVVRTQGSDNVSCTGLLSSSSATLTQQQPTNSTSPGHNKKAIIASVCGLAGTLLLLGGLSWLYKYHRRKQQRKTLAVLPRQFNEKDGQARPIISSDISTAARFIPFLPIAFAPRSIHKSATVSEAGRLQSSSTSGIIPENDGAIAASTHDEIVIQHHDGGAIRELPPPYAEIREVGSAT